MIKFFKVRWFLVTLVSSWCGASVLPASFLLSLRSPSPRPHSLFPLPRLTIQGLASCMEVSQYVDFLHDIWLPQRECSRQNLEAVSVLRSGPETGTASRLANSTGQSSHRIQPDSKGRTETDFTTQWQDCQTFWREVWSAMTLACKVLVASTTGKSPAVVDWNIRSNLVALCLTPFVVILHPADPASVLTTAPKPFSWTCHTLWAQRLGCPDAHAAQLSLPSPAQSRTPYSCLTLSVTSLLRNNRCLCVWALREPFP